MKRFYREAGTAAADAGTLVVLDDRPVRTPARRQLVAPTPALALAIAAEWRAQGGEIRPADMPLTRMACTALDLLPTRRRDAVDEAAGYGETDLLCYRADRPPELAARQRRTWQPLLDWAEATFGARLTVTASALPVAQPAAALARLREAVEAGDDWSLTGLHAATTALGSVVLGLALRERRLTAEAAFAAGLLDELFEAEQWGEDPEAAARRERLRREIEAAGRFMTLSRSG
ncbi:MAG TPA: ATP12 family protein [Geminicoccaceae bacterium]|nr:ATP12 family protein [Geminicoccaceae bacterium]